MTNEQIILNERFELMKSGKIGTTGKYIYIEDEEGNKKKVKEPAQLHTFFAWKKKGYKVKHGEHAITKLDIWKRTKNDSDDKEENDKKPIFMKMTMFFFADSQVEPLQKAE